MKILTFTDIHGSLSAFESIEKLADKENPDILVDCGDISIFENDLDYLVERVAAIGKKCLIIHGNHEFASSFSQACKPHKNMIFLHNKVHRVGDYVFFGWGGGGFSRKDREFERAARRIIKRTRKGDKIILFTHAPMYNTKLDDLYGDHAGNKSIRDFIEKHKPVLALCGHFHENNGKKGKIGKTIIMNPGPMGKIVNV